AEATAGDRPGSNCELAKRRPSAHPAGHRPGQSRPRESRRLPDHPKEAIMTARFSHAPALRHGLALALGVSVLGVPARAAGHDAHHGGNAPLGRVDFPVSCSKEAQNAFTRAVALLHHMTYPQAEEAFIAITNTEPQCAMAHWGIAMTLFQPLWPTRPGPAALQRGWDEVQKAKSLAPPTERERLFIAAAEAFFLDPAGSDYWARIHRWEQAMQKAYATFPEDPEVTAFYALSHLAAA